MERFGIYVGYFEEDNDLNEITSGSEGRADLILIGTFNEKNEFVGFVITNWCDKYSTDTLIFNNKTVWDVGGYAEDEEGNDLWVEVKKQDPDFWSKIEVFYEYLNSDEDDDHYNLGKAILDESRLFHGFSGSSIPMDGSKGIDGFSINLLNVKTSNGFKLNLNNSNRLRFL